MLRAHTYYKHGIIRLITSTIMFALCPDNTIRMAIVSISIMLTGACVRACACVGWAVRSVGPHAGERRIQAMPYLHVAALLPRRCKQAHTVRKRQVPKQRAAPRAQLPVPEWGTYACVPTLEYAGGGRSDS